MLELLKPQQMSEADRRAIASGVAGVDLMERAGEAVFDAIVERYASIRTWILCGPGNNGGDGYVVARLLAESGWDVRLIAIGSPRKGSDAAIMAGRWEREISGIDDFSPQADDLIVDALFGAGLDRDLEGLAAKLVGQANDSGAAIVAVDMPSGVGGASGQVRGVATKAEMSVTFARLKPGHVLLPGRDLCGDVVLADIGIPDKIVQGLGCQTFVNDPGLWWQTGISSAEHKYDRGHCAVVSGSEFQTGASRLAAWAAFRAGAGLVTLIGEQDALRVHAAHVSSIMLRPFLGADAEDWIGDRKLNCLVIGPAAGLGEATRRRVLTWLEHARPVVIDADALTSFASAPEILFDAIKAGPGHNAVLTPHEGEFKRVFPMVEGDNKLDRARKAAEMSGATVVLKGADTVIAAPNGFAIVNDNAPPSLAVAGSGDVLAGLTGGFLAQSYPGPDAAAAAVYVHGLAAQLFGKRGMVAEDIVAQVPTALSVVDGQSIEQLIE